VASVLRGFKDFVLRGNVVDLAVAVVIGAAFGAVVTALVKDIVTPLVAVIFGEHDFSALTFTINGSEFHYGDFLNAVIAFLSVAAAIYFFVVVPMNALLAARRRGEDAEEADSRPCSECLSEIPKEAKRCAFCTSPQPGVANA
jgi:large conductance mechanosensitive channel